MCQVAARDAVRGSCRSSRLATIGALALFVLFAPHPALQADSQALTVVSLEAESMTSWWNLAGGGIAIVGCSGARGGLAVDGVDVAGEYIEWPLVLTQDFVFRDSLRSAGSIGIVREFAVLFLPAGGGPPAAADTLVTPPGAGIG